MEYKIEKDIPVPKKPKLGVPLLHGRLFYELVYFSSKSRLRSRKTMRNLEFELIDAPAGEIGSAKEYSVNVYFREEVEQ